MKTIIASSLLVFGVLQICVAPPVTQNKDKEKEEEENVGGLEDYMEYHRYLREVVNALESDPQFREKLEKAEEHDIRSGKIAEELEFVSHNVRTRLDEIKRVELNRLRELTEQKRRLQEGIDMEDPSHRHLDHTNPHTFEIDDLKKLIAKTTEDLAEADRRRREEFKQYEMQKEFDKQVKLNHTDANEREKLEREFKEREEKHKKHEKLHEPGHKAQLEEVWEKQDQMQQEFDPKTFFMLHDLDSNGLWDQDEVKALFIKELEKMYAAGEPEDDMRERAEEMERMRESVFKEVDTNRDGFIDYDEFLAQTKRNDFQQDHGWQGLDERKPYTDEELEEYIRQHQIAQAQHLAQVAAQAAGYGNYYPPQGQVPPGGYQQGYHPNAVPPQQYHPGPPQQVHPGAVPPQQYHPGQVPQQPPQQFHPGQVPQQPPQQLPGHLPDLNTNEIHQQNPQGYQQPIHQRQPQGGYQQQQPPQKVNYQQGGQQQQQPQGGHQQQQQQQQQPPQGGYQQQQPPQGGYQQQQPPQGGYQQQPPQQGGYQQQQQPPQPPQAVNPPQVQQPMGNVPQNVPVPGKNGNQGSPQANQV